MHPIDWQTLHSTPSLSLSPITGKAARSSRSGSVRVPGRGIPGSAGQYPGWSQGYRERDRDDENDASH